MVAKSLREWYDNLPSIDGTSNITIPPIEPEVVKEPEEQMTKKETQEASSMLKVIFLASMVKTTLEELFKLNDENLTKSYKEDILKKLENLKTEVESL